MRHKILPLNTRTAEKKKSRTAEEGKLTCTCISGPTPDRLKIPTSDTVLCPVGLQEPSGNYFVTAIKLIRRINYVIFVCNVVSLPFMKYKARTIWCLLFIARQKRLYLLWQGTHLFSSVQYGSVRSSKVSLPISHHILCKLSVVLATWLAWRHSRRRCRHFLPSRSSTGCRVCLRFFISPYYKYSQCRKVSEYQFHITANTANFL